VNSGGCTNPQEEAVVISKQIFIKLTKLSQIKREQLHNNTRFKDKQCEIEERKIARTRIGD